MAGHLQVVAGACRPGRGPTKYPTRTCPRQLRGLVWGCVPHYSGPEPAPAEAGPAGGPGPASGSELALPLAERQPECYWQCSAGGPGGW